MSPVLNLQIGGGAIVERDRVYGGGFTGDKKEPGQGLYRKTDIVRTHVGIADTKTGKK